MPLPPLYFQNKGVPLSAGSSASSSIRDSTSGRRTTTAPAKQNTCRTVTLPTELLATILNDHATFGDLARMAHVQKAYRHILIDSVRDRGDSTTNKNGNKNNNNGERMWQLARAMLDGTDGLAVNTKAALPLLLELVQIIPIDPSTMGPIGTFPATASEQQQQPSLSTGTSSTPFAAKAMVELGHLHLRGLVHPTTSSSSSASYSSREVGLSWLKAAFYIGHDIEAAYTIASIYEYGLYDIDIDMVLATQWLECAATAGHTESMAELGLCYELGCGVEINDTVAMEWYVRAAELGHVTANYSVGEAFESARGVPQSDAEACLWYYRAAIVGDEDSIKALRRLRDIARIVVPGIAALLDG